MIGSQVSHYRLSRKLGAGTYGEVFEGQHVHDAELKVAVKLVRQALVEDTRFVEALKRECRALDRMDHPNIVRFRELVVGESGVAMVLELLDGRDLHDRLASGALPVDTVVSVVEAILEGLAYAHSRGVMHRDIKPSNVFWCDDGRIKLLDFGIARAADGTNATQTGQMIGTLDYMAPERFDERGGSMASDVYAVGLIAWEMLAGRAACADGEFGRKLGWHLAQGVGDAAKVNLVLPACPAWFAEVIASCAARDPAARPKDGEAALALVRLGSGRVEAQVGGRRPPPLTVMGPLVATPSPIARAATPAPAPLPDGVPSTSAGAPQATLGGTVAQSSAGKPPSAPAGRVPRRGRWAAFVGVLGTAGFLLLAIVGYWWSAKPSPQAEYAAYLKLEKQLYGDADHPGDPTAADIREATAHLQVACAGGVPAACPALLNLTDEDVLSVTERLPMAMAACRRMIEDCTTLRQCEGLSDCDQLKSEDLESPIDAPSLASSLTAACESSPANDRAGYGSPCMTLLDFMRNKTWTFGALDRAARVSIANGIVDIVCTDRPAVTCADGMNPCWLRNNERGVERVFGDYESDFFMSPLWEENNSKYRCPS